ncbi:beta-N-acetylglucosaminidase domain-containing protein [Streptomyces sp. NPDC048623]|uniref:beta-N-acetylglucosaminidase domain-containing protein n=1 Tax=Streptomyces sp. NPDC048623 TaxID=3155761 RepID=UPI0034495061
MPLGRRKRTATAVAAAVIGGLLGGVLPGVAQAAPVSPVTTPDRLPATVPPVWPRPQSIAPAGEAVPLGTEVTLLAAPDADAYAVGALRALLRAAGVRTVHEALPGRGPVIRFGDSVETDAALRALKVPERGDLPDGGYRLATGRLAGRDTVVVDGAGEDGLFHAVQTLRQLVGPQATVPGVVVRDWPGTAVRGLTEGFYGQPWTPSERLAQIDFMGRTKQNRYLYAPGDDPYRRALWREPYPAAERAALRELAARATANHVTLAWAVAPAQAMCLSSDEDVTALTKKIDAMWALGVRAFQLQFQDVSYSEWSCDEDADAFGSGPEAAARAHARVANAVSAHLARRYPGAAPLSLMPTEYYQDGATDYRSALARTLDRYVEVAWTGVGAVPRTITGRELAGARDALRHPLVTMDNYPVNDYAQDRLFLGPATGREPAVAVGSAAFLANAMEQAAASRVPLFTAADFAWNPKGYRPQESWRAAVDELAGPDPAAREALGALAGNGASSILAPDAESAYLKPLAAAFWAARADGNPAAREKAGRELRAAFTVMRQAPERLKGTADGALGAEAGPWLDRLARYGAAGETAVDMLLAQARGDGAGAWRAQLELERKRAGLRTGAGAGTGTGAGAGAGAGTGAGAGAGGGAGRVTVGKGVLDAFLDRAAAESAAWTGADRAPSRTGEPTRDGGAAGGVASGDTYTVRLDRSRPVETLTVMTDPAGDSADTVGTVGTGFLEAYVPGEGWRRIGPLAASGWTQADLKGLRAEALRIVWTGAGAPPRVRSLVPWFADEPRAGLALSRTETDAEIGGPAQRVEVTLEGRRAAEVRGPLTAQAPKGITVRLPEEAVVPRGTTATVPLEVSVAPGVPSGSYTVPVSFAGERQVLTVRAFPRTAGPDLARTATASSSGDETPDFPAALAVDGDPATRWSSSLEDGAWWQVELAEPARIGQVVLHWQDAYASRYRVQVSADGRVWRTAATVRDGRGGRESVRMDAADTRFLRIQGDARATEYGYSLWSVETYAVAPASGEPAGAGAPEGEPDGTAPDSP